MFSYTPEFSITLNILILRKIMMKPKPEDFIQNTTSALSPHYMQYKGVFDMQDLYESIADFFMQKKFKFYEKQQRYRKPGPIGPEILYQFEALREIEDYYQWRINLNIETFDLHDVEVVLKDGSRKKMTKGRLWVQMWATTEVDYHKTWETSAFIARLKSFYNKYMIRKKFEGVWWDEMYYNILLQLHALIRERLKMSSEVYEHRHFDRTH